ncbi:galactokinase [Saccharopolyspora kobensis]|uniref:Galactokinase n=1 Tax=Saccharopolyspora kobensis TaxID=146035 RepID=A0A1H6DP91_9PSEU|nr:galactokinase [Saccharopolyspora kobensis]SEG87100.1 galactokinase [Saccharopolyspora kobensis]SFE07933.1 galactokinase [Saccharopolyspora kobensis]
MTSAERAAALFAEEHGNAASAVWSAPGRVNLIGEHTDYNDGFVLPFALPHRTAVAVRPRTDGRLSMATFGSDGRLHRSPEIAVEDLRPGSPGGWAAYPAGVAWALREAGFPLRGADLMIVGEVPTGAGLSSSHALECATALALLDTANAAPGQPGAPTLGEIARLVQRAENDFAGAPTGLLDQTASLSCTEAHALFFDVRTGVGEQIPFDPVRTGLEVLVIDTRVKHSHSESGYGERRRGCERAAELLERKALRDVAAAELPTVLPQLPEELRPLVRHVVTENDRVLATVDELRAGRYAEIGPLLNASHASLRDDYRISSPELDLAVDSALAAGALGSRMIGGGFGGSAIALVPVPDRTKIEQAVLDAFARANLTAPRLFTAVPSAGAGRDR